MLNTSPRSGKPRSSRILRGMLEELRPYLLNAGWFSLGMNILLLAPSLYMLLVFDRVLTSRSSETLGVLTLGVLVALTFNFLLDAVRARLLAAVGGAMDQRLGAVVLAGVLARSARSGVSDHGQSLRDVGVLRSFFAGPGVIALFDAPWLPIYLLVIFLFHPLMALCALVGIGVLVALTWFSERVTKPRLEQAQGETMAASRFMDSAMRNVEAIQAMGMVKQMTAHWDSRNAKVLKAQAGVSTTQSWITAGGRGVRQVLQAFMTGLGAWLVLGSDVAPGIMVASTILLGRVLQPMEGILAGWKVLVGVRGSWARLSDLLATEQEARPATELPAPSGRLTAERIVFTPPGREHPVIKGIQFALEAGESLAIIGPSGSGKSTLARLLTGVWRAQSGVVRLDGADIGQWPRDALGPHLGYIPQDVELFACSAAENIARLGEVDSEAVIAAARGARAHELILNLPQGYETNLGEGGALISAGQRQRIALARALYGGPRLVVMDEPNSNLDTDGEAALQEVIGGLKQQGVTQIIVTHRPALLHSVDKVMLLRDGQIELFGPREEVLAQVLRPATALPGRPA
ncbi:MAG: type I secretion system permease/ATPase [Betaproteobacteria bacterium]|nr:type I secretion system permease/ATPase [Betaproteobacteria bacterium]